MSMFGTNPAPPPVETFSQALKHWRHSRRLSQLELAGRAGVSSRHLCFLESGRSQPSRDMVRMLGAALDLPLDACNALHLAAGFVPPHAAMEVTAETMPHVRQALDFMLSQQEPYPAIVVDGHWDVKLRNAAAVRLLGPFRKCCDMEADVADNAMHTVFHPRGLRQFIVNWAEFAGAMIQLLHGDVARGSAVSLRLLEEIKRYPDLNGVWRPAARHHSTGPVMTMQLRMGNLGLSFFSAFTTFALTSDAGLQQLKIESFFPADTATAEFARISARAPVEISR